MFKYNTIFLIFCIFVFAFPSFVLADEESKSFDQAEEIEELETPKDQSNPEPDLPSSYSIFDDKMLLDGYTEKYSTETKKIIIAMIKDETLNTYKTAAAVRVFKEKFSKETFNREKRIMEKVLLRKLNRTNSPFVQIEIMSTLCHMDRYKYFKSMIPSLIQKLDHYNRTVNEIAFDNLNSIIDSGHNRAREARIIFNTLRKVLFLSRRKLAKMSKPTERLSQKIKILRWSIKVLGKQELKRLPKEVIHLL